MSTAVQSSDILASLITELGHLHSTAASLLAETETRSKQLERIYQSWRVLLRLPLETEEADKEVFARGIAVVLDELVGRLLVSHRGIREHIDARYAHIEIVTSESGDIMEDVLQETWYFVQEAVRGVEEVVRVQQTLMEKWGLDWGLYRPRRILGVVVN